MSNLELLRRLGLFLERDLLETHLCAAIVAEMRSATAELATVYAPESRIDESIRKTRMTRVKHSTAGLVKARLLACQPKLESHFRVTLRGLQEPGFLLYRKGDFFTAHQDRGDSPEDSQRVRERQISLVIFLNAQA